MLACLVALVGAFLPWTSVEMGMRGATLVTRGVSYAYIPASVLVCLGSALVSILVHPAAIRPAPALFVSFLGALVTLCFPVGILAARQILDVPQRHAPGVWITLCATLAAVLFSALALRAAARDARQGWVDAAAFD